MVCLLECNFLTRQCNERDGKKYFNVTVMQNDSVMQISCDENVYNGLFKSKPMDKVTLSIKLSVFGQQKNFRVVGVQC